MGSSRSTTSATAAARPGKGNAVVLFLYFCCVFDFVVPIIPIITKGVKTFRWHRSPGKKKVQEEKNAIKNT
jgi:hypothetical protein